MGRRGRIEAHAILAPIGTDQPSNPRSRCSEISCDVRVCMEENIKGKIDPEPGELEYHRLVRVLKHPDSSVS